MVPASRKKHVKCIYIFFEFYCLLKSIVVIRTLQPPSGYVDIDHLKNEGYQIQEKSIRDETGENKGTKTKDFNVYDYVHVINVGNNTNPRFGEQH